MPGSPSRLTGRILASLAVFVAFVAAADEVCADARAVPLRDYLRHTWQTGEGLPQNSVRAIVQSRDGYVWLATAEGLVRFDGVHFTVFNRNSRPALPSNNIDSLFETRDGALWIGLRRAGLARLADGKVEIWTTAQGLSLNEITGLAEGQDGSLWIGTNGGGLNRIQNGRIHTYRRADGLPDDFIWGLSVAPDGAVWAATGGGVARWADGRFTTLTSRDGLPADITRAVLADRAGRVWIGTPQGLSVFADGHLSTVSREPDTRETPDTEIIALAEGRDGSLWIGTRANGLARLRDGRLETLTPSDGLPDDSVLAIREDREGNLWIGQSAGGVSLLRPTPFRTVAKRDGLPTDVIRAVHEGRDGSLWAATNGLGLARVHEGQVQRWTVADGLPHNAVSMIGETRSGVMWIGTHDGLVMMRDGRFVPYSRASGLPNLNIRAFLEDRAGRVWIGTADGVCRIEGRRCVVVPELPGRVRALHETADGAIWLGGHAGLRRYRNGQVTTWTTKEGLSNDFIASIAEDTDGVLFVGTVGGGLNRVDGDRVTAYRMEDGLYDDIVYRALPDGRGSVWMTSNRGLFRVSRADLDGFMAGRLKRVTSQAYTEADGLPSSEFNGGSFPSGIVARNGDLWLPSVRGVVKVDLSAFVSHTTVPPVTIEQVTIDSRTHDPHVPIEAVPGEGRIEIHYTALSFAAPSRTRFRFRLEGFDREWVEAGTRRAAYYTNVPPGRYQFHVVASNEAGEWSRGETVLAVALRPHFYQTTWFMAGMMLMSAFAAYGGVRWRARQTRLRERRLQELVEARTRELQEEVAERRRAQEALVEAREAALAASRLKSEFIANVSHEIRTPMNGVIGMTDLALESPLPGDVRSCLEVVRSSADALLLVINDILDFSKIEAGKLDLAPTDFNVRALIDQLITIFQPRASEKGLTLESAIDGDVPEAIVADGLRVRQVVTNLVGNALKFTERGRVRIAIARAPEQPEPPGRVALRVSVSDTGIGIPHDHQQRIFDAFTQADGSTTRRFGGTGLGLTISARLVALMGGELTVSSEPGQGSTFAFMIFVGRGEARPQPAAAPLPVPIAPHSLRVLVAEDNLVNQTVAARVLQRAGHVVTVVDSGTAAVDIVARERFDVVLMDVQMPGMNGFEATAAIRAGEAGRRRVPIIALTAHAMRGDRERCLAAGMDGYVSKPLRASELHGALAAVARPAA